MQFSITGTIKTYFFKCCYKRYRYGINNIMIIVNIFIVNLYYYTNINITTAIDYRLFHYSVYEGHVFLFGITVLSKR